MPILKHCTLQNISKYVVNFFDTEDQFVSFFQLFDIPYLLFVKFFDFRYQKSAGYHQYRISNTFRCPIFNPNTSGTFPTLGRYRYLLHLDTNPPVQIIESDFQTSFYYATQALADATFYLTYNKRAS